jgi:hypothetical protein
MNVRKHVLSALAGAAALAGVMITAPPANAEPNPPGCPKGYLCACSEPNQGGTLLMKTAGDWSGEIHHVGSVFHNGYVFPGADHIDLSHGYTTSVRRIRLHCTRSGTVRSQHHLRHDRDGEVAGRMLSGPRELCQPPAPQ